MISKFICLSGLPRSGSTLLSAILSQNPSIHAEGNSAVCQLMWDMQQSCKGEAYEQLLANDRLQTGLELINAIPHIYYKNVTSPIIIDKCRSWTLKPNMDLLKMCVTASPKVIVLERPIVDIVKSFVSLRIQNNYHGDPEEGLLDEWSEPIMRSWQGVKSAKENDNGEFLYIQYDDLVNNTQDVLNKIYEFCEIELFEHDLNNIVNKHPENDGTYKLIGQHDIRPTISKRTISVKLSDKLLARCAELDK
jgi:sulfotransferase